MSRQLLRFLPFGRMSQFHTARSIPESLPNLLAPSILRGHSGTLAQAGALPLGLFFRAGRSTATELPHHAVDPPDHEGEEKPIEPGWWSRWAVQIAVEKINRYASDEDRDDDHPSWSAHPQKVARTVAQGSFRNTGLGARRLRPWGRTLSGMKVLSGIAVLVLAGVLMAAGGSSSHTAVPLHQRMAVAARKLALVMNDSLPANTAQVYGPASYRIALDAWNDFARPPRQQKGLWYVIVVSGRFVWHGPFRPSRGSFAARLWSPTLANSGIGTSSLSSKLPASLARLGRPILISLR
jgi:hypothetical protein